MYYTAVARLGFKRRATAVPKLAINSVRRGSSTTFETGLNKLKARTQKIGSRKSEVGSRKSEILSLAFVSFTCTRT